tara:strand:- start:437 stop:691 length:255 start_codon:yes stop_codon:yes gene_type:complete
MMNMGKKDKGGMVVAIMEKMKDSYGKGKKSNEEFVEEEEHEEKDYDNGYDAVVDEILESIESKDKEKFKHSLKSFIEMCLDEKE